MNAVAGRLPTIYAIAKFPGAENTSFEHVKGGNSNALAPFVNTSSFWFGEPPVITCPSVEKHGNKEEIYQPAADLSFLAALGVPRLNELSDSLSASHVKMLPASVRGDCVIFVRPKVSLSAVSRW